MKKLLVLLLIILLIGINGCKINKDIVKQNYVEIEDKKIFVEMPGTPEEFMQGLMYREELCEECGMLFIFPKEDFHSFWMKNTLIPLDMVFINAESEVVDVLHPTPCAQDPCKRYVPKEKALYVLETNQNLFNKETIGKKVIITYAQDT